MIRLATAADAEAISAIYAPIVVNTAISFEEAPPDASEMRRRLAAGGDRYPWFAADCDGEVAGFAYAAQHRERAAYRWSVDVSVYLAEHARGQGLGRALYSRLLEQLIGQGYCNAFAGVVLPNPASCALHETMGFTPVGIYRRVGYKFGRWHDVRWYERRLHEPAGAPAEPRVLVLPRP